MQPLQLVVFDTEFTAWPGSNERGWSESWEFRELIQLAAVKIEISQKKASVLSSFNQLIKPKINPVLSDYIIELTGISQEMVDEMGIDCVSAISHFQHFCMEGELACFAWGNDGDILLENCRLNDQVCPEFNKGVINLKKLAEQYSLAGAHLSSGELATFFNVELQGHKHNALYDVRSLATALDRWISTGQLPLKSLSPLL